MLEALRLSLIVACNHRNTICVIMQKRFPRRLQQKFPVDHRLEVESSPHFLILNTNQILGRNMPRFLQTGGACQFHQLLPVFFRRFQRVRCQSLRRILEIDGHAAFHDCPGDQSSGVRRGQQILHAACSGRLSRDRDFVRISAKCADVAVHPADRRELVLQTEVALSSLRILFPQPRMREKSHHSQPIRDSHNNHSFSGHMFPVKLHLIGIAALISAAMDIEQNRQVFLPGPRRRKDIQIQAVLAHLEFRAGRMDFPGPELRRIQSGHRLTGNRSILVSHPDAVPRLDRLGSLPAQFSDRCFRIRHALKHSDPRIPAKDSLQLSTLCFHHPLIHLRSPFCVTVSHS